MSFNGTPASFTITSPITLTTGVPTGATSRPLTLTTPGGSVTTPGSFLVLPALDVSLSVEPGLLTAIAGSSVSLLVRTSASGGFTGLTTLSAGALPDGVTVTFSAPALGPNASGVLTLTPSASTPSPATLTVQGTTTLEGATVTRSAMATLTVLASGTQTTLAGQVLDEDASPLPKGGWF